MAYATADQYLLVYDTSASTERLEAYLGRASRKIDAALASRGASVPPLHFEKLSEALCDVCCDVVHRVLGDAGASDMPDGITSYSQSAGGLSESFSWAQPYTDMAVRDDELKWLLELLGVDTSGVGAFRAWGGESE